MIHIALSLPDALLTTSDPVQRRANLTFSLYLLKIQLLSDAVKNNFDRAYGTSSSKLKSNF